MPSFTPRRGITALENAASSGGSSKYRGFVPEIRWKEDGEKKYVLILSTFEDDDPNGVVVADLHSFIEVGKGEKANGETYTQYETFVSRKDPIAGSEDYDDLEDRLGQKPKTRCLGVGIELEPEFETVKGRKRPVGFTVKTDTFTRKTDDGDEEVTQPLIGIINQSAFLVWSPLGALDASQGPLTDAPVEIVRSGSGVNTRYNFAAFTEKPVDLEPLFDNLDGVTYIKDELEDFDAGEGTVEDAQEVARVLLDKYLTVLADKDRYDELVGPIDHIESRFGPKTKAEPAKKPAARKTAAGKADTTDKFSKLRANHSA